MRAKVLTDRCTLGVRGRTVTVDETDCAIRALVQSGHIELIAPKPVDPPAEAPVAEEEVSDVDPGA